MYVLELDPADEALNLIMNAAEDGIILSGYKDKLKKIKDIFDHTDPFFSDNVRKSQVDRLVECEQIINKITGEKSKSVRAKV